MTVEGSAPAARAVGAMEKLRALHGPGERLAAVPIPALPEWNRRIRMAEVA